jgi:hypothetical protein
MGQNPEKIIGYVLLGIGVLFIVIALHNVYTVFTGVAAAPEMFKIANIKIDLPNNTGSAELVAGDVASKFLNLMLWYILMFFLATAGNLIAGLGVTLLRQIKVTVKSKDGLTNIPTE